MAGYSGTPLARKLGIGPNSRVLIFDEPPGFRDILDGLPEGVEIVNRFEPDQRYGVVLQFATQTKEIASIVEAVIAALEPAGGYWIAWPKKASKVQTDIVEQKLRDLLLPATPLVDNKVCAIDETWSGLRFVRRKELR